MRIAGPVNANNGRFLAAVAAAGMAISLEPDFIVGDELAKRPARASCCRVSGRPPRRSMPFIRAGATCRPRCARSSISSPSDSPATPPGASPALGTPRASALARAGAALDNETMTTDNEVEATAGYAERERAMRGSAQIADPEMEHVKRVPVACIGTIVVSDDSIASVERFGRVARYPWRIDIVQLLDGFQSALNPHSPEAAATAGLAWVLFIGAAIIFIAVMALAVVAIRSRPAWLAQQRIVSSGAASHFRSLVLSRAARVFGAGVSPAQARAGRASHRGRRPSMVVARALSRRGRQARLRDGERDPPARSANASSSRSHRPTCCTASGYRISRASST